MYLLTNIRGRLRGAALAFGLGAALLPVVALAAPGFITYNSGYEPGSELYIAYPPADTNRITFGAYETVGFWNGVIYIDNVQVAACAPCTDSARLNYTWNTTASLEPILIHLVRTPHGQAPNDKGLYFWVGGYNVRTITTGAGGLVGGADTPSAVPGHWATSGIAGSAMPGGWTLDGVFSAASGMVGGKTGILGGFVITIMGLMLAVVIAGTIIDVVRGWMGLNEGANGLTGREEQRIKRARARHALAKANYMDSQVPGMERQTAANKQENEAWNYEMGEMERKDKKISQSDLPDHSKAIIRGGV